MTQDLLNEAADAHIRKVVDTAGHPGWDWTTQDIAEAFIAGVKWAMEQGIIGEGEIVKDISNKLAVTAKIPELSADFKFGDKVIVQIRKKDD